MVMWSRVVRSTSVPTQELSPMVGFHGHWMRTRCRISTPWPICAPKVRRIAMRMALGHHPAEDGALRHPQRLREKSPALVVGTSPACC